MINRLKDILPNLIGGAADLAPSTKTYMKGEGDFPVRTAQAETCTLVFVSWRWQLSQMALHCTAACVRMSRPSSCSAIM